MKLITKQIGGNLIGAILLALAGAQLVVVVNTIIRPWQHQLNDVWGEPAWRRAGTAGLYLGPTRTEYLRFARSTIPEGAVVVIPSEGYGGIFRFGNLMQAYFFPREIEKCPTEGIIDCIIGIQEANVPGQVAVLQVGDFPPDEISGQGFRFHKYSEDFGVFIWETTDNNDAQR